MNTNRAGLAHHPETGPARPCLPTIANILRRRTTGGQGANRARGASDSGAAMGVAAPQVASGLRPAKRSAHPLTNSGVARIPEGKALVAQLFGLDVDNHAELHALLTRAQQLIWGMPR